ncbi:MAG: hypothetical protein FJ385_05620 [Verrucomicrobia bacterium]|nr:hypothetical protein [Verrucomicrobiota bacterium]
MIRLFTAIFCATIAFAQADAPAQRLMDEGIRTFESALHDWHCDGFRQSAERFDQALRSGAAPAEARYWAGVARFHRMLCLRHPHDGGTDRKSADEAMQSALGSLDAVIEIEPAHAEAQALLGTLLGMKIQGGLLRAILHGPQVARHQSQALKHGASNPRVRYLNGAGLLHTAKSARALNEALDELRAAEALFEAEARRPAVGRDPRWGAAGCQQFIGRTLERLDRDKEAAAAYRKALSLQPGDHESAAALRRLNMPP